MMKAFLVGLMILSGAAMAAITPSGSNAEHGVGLATYGSGGGVGLGSGALSAICITDKTSLQVLAAIPSASPFQFGVGGIGRYTMAGTKDHGLHAGAGINLGLTSTGVTTPFFFNFLALGGFHFKLNDSLKNIMFHFDGAFVLAATPTLNIALGPLGGFFGSIHYLL